MKSMRCTVPACLLLSLVVVPCLPADEPPALPDQYATAVLQVDGMI